MGKMKKIITLILSLILALCAFPLSAFADDNYFDKDTIEYYKNLGLQGTTVNVYNWGEYISDGSEGSMDVVKEFTGKLPILGICLGHQCIAEALGGTVSYAKKLYHGKQSAIEHDGTSIFTGIDSPIKVARYHSLAVQEDDLPEVLRVLARTDDGEIMAIRHKEYPVVGLQFHPESIYTEHGKRIVYCKIKM